MDAYWIVLRRRQLLASLTLGGFHAYEMGLACTGTGSDSTPVGEFCKWALR